MEELQQKQQASTLEVDRLSLHMQELSQSQSQSCLELGSRDAEEVENVDQCCIVGNKENSQLVEIPVTLAGDVDLMKTEDGSLTNTEVKVDVKVHETSLAKRKRGRPPKSQTRTTPPVRKEKDEEDVCFICFDGGSLVLCDRRSCPKAYHPACIKRDEAFFRTRAKWNCGWHICSICQKASHYMCYTCTYSLCKGCAEDADYLCVRGNYGFCGMCMRTIMLIENSAQGNKEKCEVDFDDQRCWEYLFKVYWIYLKTKLSLTLDELTRAQSPWKGDVVMDPNGQSSRVLNRSRDKRFSIPENSSLYIETSDSKRRMTFDDSNCINGEDSKSMKFTLSKATKWASDELLEFVGHMKNGDTSVLSQFDVQALLLEYIKENNLYDPLQKYQIICDSRLINLFGKARLGHIEMQKLLESHFIIREKTSAENSANLRILNTITGPGETNGLSENQLIIAGDKRCKALKIIDLQAPENDLNAYAAINSHNIKLIYLSRNQMENFIDDVGQFHHKVVGSIVRVKVPNGDQKPDMYRLVQVVGTSKVARRYNVGTRTTDLMLEVINLNKKEVISIDGISDQEFSEDECRRFRQSIKCGLSKCLTVLEVQEKALTFQAMRINKLQLLDSQEERQRNLHEIPEVHSDPTMDPSYESDDDDDGDVAVREAKKDDNLRSIDNDFNRKMAESISPRSRNYVFNDAGNRVNNTLATNCMQLGGKPIVENAINATAQENEDSNNAMAMISKLSALLAADIVPSQNLKRTEQPVNDFESDNIWHYEDPSRKTQGPFSLFQLRRWYTAGHFPADLRVWKTDQKKDDSILLTDALNGKCHENVSPGQFISLGVTVCTDGGDPVKSRGISNSDDSIDQKLKKSSPQNNCSDESVKSNGWNCHLSGQSESTQTSLDLAKWDVLCHGKAQVSQPLPSTAFTAMLQETTFELKREGYRTEINSDANDGNQNLLKSAVSHGDQVLLKQSDREGHSVQSSEHNWRHPPVSGFSSFLDSTNTFVSIPACNESNWNAIIGEANEFNSLVDESVSDLLAEVEAMESLGGLDSATSIMNCGKELTDGSKNDCLSSVEVLRPMPDQDKGDALRSMTGAKLPTLSTVSEASHAGYQADILHYQRISTPLPTACAQSGGATKKSDTIGRQWEAGTGIPVSVQPSTATWDLTDTTWRLGLDSANTSWGTTQGNTNVGWSALKEGNSNMNWGVAQGHENGSLSSCTTTGNPVVWGTQTRYVNDRFSSPCNRDFHGRDSSTGSGRDVGNRQPFFGMTNGGGSHSHSDARKGLGVCKYYERGHCKNGASCSSWHP